MHTLSFLLGLLTGAIAGAALVWLSARRHLGDTFKALAADSLRDNAESFLQLAETRLKQSENAAASTLDKKTTAIDEMVKPVKDTLAKMGEQLHALEVKREGAYADVLKAVHASNETQNLLRAETGQLLQALHSSTTRGNWCQEQLKRIFEMAGMAQHLQDFSAQHTMDGDDGKLRPDYVVALSGGRSVIFDCKAPMNAYLQYAQSTDAATKKELLAKHAKQVREHIRDLGSKEYWSHSGSTPEFVVMFMPENLLAAALEADPTLFDDAIRYKIILSTQTTVLAVMWSVAHGWKEEALRDNVRKIGELGGELYSAVLTMAGHIATLGGKIGSSMDAYNKMVGSIERNVLGKAKKLREFGAARDSGTLPETLEQLEGQPRRLEIEPAANEDAA